MRKRVVWVVALAFCAACTESGLRASQLTLGGSPQRIAGTGALAQPRFAGGSGSFLTVTDGGQPNMVFKVNAVTLEVDPVSFRPPPPGVPATPTSIGEFVRDMLVVPDDDSSGGTVAGTGRAAAFLSQASNLLEPGTGVFFYRDSTQAFAKDLVTGENFLVSSTPDGLPCNSDVTSAAMSSGGRFVVFATRATDLYDPVNPSQAPNGASQIYIRDLLTGDLRLISAPPSSGDPGTGDSTDPVVTPDGRFVAFRSEAANLVTGDTNMAADIFVYDGQNMTMTLVSVGPFTAPAEPTMSQNGNFIAFTALLGMTRQVLLRDVSAGTTALVSANPVPGDADSTSPSISADATLLAFASKSSNLGGFLDTLGVSDVFLVNLGTGVLTQVSISTDGLSNGDGESVQPTISPDNSFLAYISTALNVAANDPDREDGDANGLANLILVPTGF